MDELKAGNTAALATIYYHYFDTLFLYAYNVLKDQGLAEDIVQELFISLWNRRESLQIRTSLQTYLFTSNRYQIIKAVRSRVQNSSLFQNLEERILTSSDSDALLYSKELRDRVTKIVSQLPEKCREIFLLSREQQLSNTEIARKLNISVKTVENQITIALRKIREALGILMAFLPFVS
ncbi:MAG TPA: RNA polymerase sigma-70 factor [Parasegetibacter sp.]